MTKPLTTTLLTHTLTVIRLSSLLNAFNKGYGQNQEEWEVVRAAIPWSFGDSQHTLIHRNTFYNGMGGEDVLGCTEDEYLALVPEGCFIDLEN